MVLNEAYKKIFGKEPDKMEEWEIARDIMDNWNVPVLGEDMAKEVIFKVVNHVIFPSNEITREVVLRAENYATELFDELRTDEPHMAELERLETEYARRKDELKGPKII